MNYDFFVAHTRDGVQAALDLYERLEAARPGAVFLDIRTLPAGALWDVAIKTAYSNAFSADSEKSVGQRIFLIRIASSRILRPPSVNSALSPGLSSLFYSVSGH